MGSPGEVISHGTCTIQYRCREGSRACRDLTCCKVTTFHFCGRYFKFAESYTGVNDGDKDVLVPCGVRKQRHLNCCVASGKSVRFILKLRISVFMPSVTCHFQGRNKKRQIAAVYIQMNRATYLDDGICRCTCCIASLGLNLMEGQR